MLALRRVVVLVLLAGFVAWCARHLRSDFQGISLDSLGHAIPAIALATLLSLVNYALRILRWRMYFANLGHEQSIGFTSLVYLAGFAFTLSPAKVGELMRARYYMAKGVPLGDFAAVSLIERLMDVVAMLLLAMAALALFPAYESAMFAIAGLSAAGVLALAFLPWNALAERAAASQRMSRLALVTARLAHAVLAARSLLRPRPLISGLSISVFAWGAEGVGLYLLCSISTSASIELAPAVGLYAVAVLAGAATFLPGGLVGTEAVMTAMLAATGFPVSDALLITLVCRVVTLWFAVLLGWAAVAALGTRACTVQPCR